MPPALPLVRVVADSRNAGKTRLARALIEELTARGYLVAAVKHSHHPVPLDKAGSDTERFAEAGASRVVFAAADGVVIRQRGPIPLSDAVAELVGRVDLAIVEGFKGDELGAVLHIDSVSGLATLTSMDGRRVTTSQRDDVLGVADALVDLFELTSDGDELLRASLRRAAAAHGHMCPGVTLGVRMAMAGANALGLSLPAPHQLRVVVETARCATDAIGSVTGCSAGRRNLRVEECGAMAARFTNAETGASVRVVVQDAARELALILAPHAVSRRHAQSIAYRTLPDASLLDIRCEEPRSD